MVARRKTRKSKIKRRKKSKGHPGFSFVCRKKGWTFARWEKLVKDIKKKSRNKRTNPYAVANSICLRSKSKTRSRRRKS